MIIPAAGYGTRLRGITGGASKEVVEVGGQPALQFALQEAVKVGLSRVGIIIRPGKEDIVRVVQNDPRLASMRSRLQIVFFQQEQPTGEAGAIAAAATWIEDSPFVVHYPDNIILAPKSALAKLLARFQELNTDIVLLTLITGHAQAKPCRLLPAGNGVYTLSPREPAPPSQVLRPTGVYVATTAFLKTCQTLVQSSKFSEIKDQDVRRTLAKIDHVTLGLDLAAEILDIGNPDGYEHARSLFDTPSLELRHD